MLGVIATMLIIHLCWPGIQWLIGTVAWLCSWYACVIECRAQPRFYRVPADAEVV
jgi:hypothetical protein